MADPTLLLAEEAQGRRRQMLRTAFGPTIAAALADPKVIEVMVNPDGKLWIERAPVGRRFTGERIGSSEAERIIRLVAAHVRREVTDRQDPHRLRRAARDGRALRGRDAACGSGAVLRRAQAGRCRLILDGAFKAAVREPDPKPPVQIVE